MQPFRKFPGQRPQQKQNARRQARDPCGESCLSRGEQEEQNEQAQPFPNVEDERQLLKIVERDLQVFSLLILTKQAQIGAMTVVSAARDDPQAAQKKGCKSERMAGFLRDQHDVIEADAVQKRSNRPDPTAQHHPFSWQRFHDSDDRFKAAALLEIVLIVVEHHVPAEH